VALNSTRRRSLLIMKNIPHIEELDVAGSSNIDIDGEI
jgi:hypothetical protein